MPIYEYRCNDCEQVFEEWLKTFDETEHACPVCGGHAERIMSNTTFVLKGGGWYVTDYGNHKASAPAPASGDASAAASSDAAPATPAPSSTPTAAANSSASAGASS